MALSAQGVKAAQVPRPMGGVILKPSTMMLRSFWGMVILYSPFFSVPFMPVTCSMVCILSLLLPGRQAMVSVLCPAVVVLVVFASLLHAAMVMPAMANSKRAAFFDRRCIFYLFNGFERDADGEHFHGLALTTFSPVATTISLPAKFILSYIPILEKFWNWGILGKRMYLCLFI